MDDDLSRNYRRWRLADESGRDDDAEAELRAMFALAVRPYDVPARFVDQTMEAVARAAAHHARRTRHTRRVVVSAAAAGGVLLAYFGSGLIGSFAAAAITGLLNLMIGTIVGAATADQSGTNVWSLVKSFGRAAEAFAANPAVTLTMLAIQAVAIATIVALQRLLGSDWESFK